jgi:hypothetical protein
VATADEVRADLLTISPLFESSAGWAPEANYERAKTDNPGVVVGPERDGQNTIAQSFVLEGGQYYRILAEAHSEGEGVANASVQVNWHSHDGAFLSAFIEDFEVSHVGGSVSRIVAAPPEATHGTLYVLAGRESNEPVHYTQMAVGPMRPLVDMLDYPIGAGSVGGYTVGAIALFAAALALYRFRRIATQWSLPLLSVFSFLGKTSSRLLVPCSITLIVATLFLQQQIFENPYDARYHQTMVDLDFQWTNFSFAFGGNPMSSFGIQHPVNAHLSPTFLLGHLVDAADRIFVQATFQALLMFGLFVVMCRSVTETLNEQVAIALIAVAYCWVPILTAGAVPFNATLGLIWQEGVLGAMAAFFLFQRVGKRSLRFSFIYGASFFVLIIWYFLMSPYAAPFFILATAFLCVGALCAVESSQEVKHKIACGTAIVLLLLLFDVHIYLLNLFGYTPQAYFRLLQPTAVGPLIDLNTSILARTILYQPSWWLEVSIFFGMAALGGLVAFRSGTASGRSLAFAGLSLQVFIHLGAAIRTLTTTTPFAFFYVELTGAWILALLAGLGVWTMLKFVLEIGEIALKNPQYLLEVSTAFGRQLPRLLLKKYEA